MTVNSLNRQLSNGNPLMYSSRPNSSSRLTAKYGVTWKRFYILAIFSLINYCNVAWHHSNTVTRNEIQNMHNLNNSQMYALKVLYNVLFVPGSILAIILHNNFSLRVWINTAAFVNAIGAWLIILTMFHYSFIYIGEALWSIVNFTIIYAAPLLAVKWFEDSKRVIVIVFIVSVTFFIADHSYGINYVIFEGVEKKTNDKQTALLALFSVKAALSVIAWIIGFLAFKSSPKKPPSEASAVYRDDDILGTIRLLYANRQFMLYIVLHILFNSYNELIPNSRDL